MPVSEVGDAVIGRGFALMHEPGSTQSVDTAKHPVDTLDNPAYGWFGLSSAVRVRVGGSDGPRAVSVAEVVSPGRGGVGAAGARPDGRAGPRRRHRHLQQRRQAPLRRPRRSTPTCPTPGSRSADPTSNAFTAAVLAEADPAYAEELQAAAVRHGRGPGVGARRGTAGDDVGARRRPARRAGAAGARDRRPATALRRRGRGGRRGPRRRRDRRSTSRRRRTCEPFEARTVAVLNRGVPGFAVDTDGTLHTSLMRSCTGLAVGRVDRPSRGAPRPTARTSSCSTGPTPSTTRWSPATATGGSRRIPARSAEFSHPLLAVVGAARARRRIAGVGLAAGDRAGGGGRSSAR